MAHAGNRGDFFFAGFQLCRWNLDQLIAFAFIQFRQFAQREGEQVPGRSNRNHPIGFCIGDKGWLQDIRSFDVLIAALRDSFFGVRLEVSWALGELGDPRALAPLVERLQDEDENVRRNAIEALVRLGDPRAAPALRTALEDQDPGVRAAAEDALTRLPPEAA